MYHNYFGLKEPAFSIAVNPHYLYMSQQHKEALAHLLYGVQGGGFVMLSGEVGTGKTTIIRCLLEQLPENTDIAIVLNPMANVSEILSTICDELGASYVKNAQSNKAYTDALYEYLLDAHGRGRNTVLLIDEAQLLSAEALEQIRLLTNLETTTQKLLQIILVGQPELNELLAQPRLRQLSQRITARFHLKPLSESETQAYIAHRLGVAGMPEGRNPFPLAIVKRIHSFTGGIPRLINIICERSLIGAYGHNKITVDKDIFDLAKKEVVGGVDQSRSPYATRYWKNIAAIASSSAAVLFLIALYFILDASDQTTTDTKVSAAPTEQSPALAETSQAQAEAPATNPIAPTPLESDYFIPGISNSQEILFNYLGFEVEHESRPCWILIKDRIECENTKLSTWDELRELNRPAVLKVTTPERFISHAVLIGLKNRSALLLTAEGKKTTVSLSDLGPRWTGEIFYIWHRPPGFNEPLRLGSSSGAVKWVAEQFALLDGQPEPLTDRKLNKALFERIKIFQRSYQLEPDGIVGQQTLLRLNEALELDSTLQKDF